MTETDFKRLEVKIDMILGVVLMKNANYNSAKVNELLETLDTKLPGRKTK